MTIIMEQLAYNSTTSTLLVFKAALVPLVAKLRTNVAQISNILYATGTLLSCFGIQGFIG